MRSFFAALTLAVVGAGGVGGVHHQEAADRRPTSIRRSIPSCRRRACARTPARAATSPTRRATRSATWTCRTTPASTGGAICCSTTGRTCSRRSWSKNVAPYTVDAAALGRHEVTVTPTSSTPAGRSSIPRQRLPDVCALDRERRDREQHGRPPRRHPRARRARDTIPTAPRLRPEHRPDGARTGARSRPGRARCLRSTCAAGNCHGTAVNALYLTCGALARGSAVELLRGAAPTSPPTPEQSELLRRPLATSQGGSYHEGGPHLRLGQRPATTRPCSRGRARRAAEPRRCLDPAFQFFAEKVQPVLVRRAA